MKKNLLLVLVVLTAKFSFSQINEQFVTNPSSWSNYSVASNHNWQWDSTYQCMKINGYGADIASEDWLVSPQVDLSVLSQTTLSFNSWTKYADSGLPAPFDVWISTNYSTGSPTSATWTALTATLPATNTFTWTPSGTISLAAYHQPVHIAFKYRCSGVASGTASQWEVDNVVLSGVSTGPVATTNAATSITTSAAMLNGLVNANGSTASVSFEYGATTSYGSTVAASPATVTGSSPTAVSANITGLTANSTIHYRVKAVGTNGTSYGLDVSFTVSGGETTSQKDTLTVMHYNILAYGVNTTYCTTSNNAKSFKDQQIRIIFPYVKPDIFTVNEMSPTASVSDALMNNDLNINGVNYYQRINGTNLGASNEINMIYYNSNKLAIKSQTAIVTDQRDINFVKFYYKAANLAATHDTAYLMCVITHLKAGNLAQNITDRATETATLMNYLSTHAITGNVLFMGDFNMYTSFEQGFQNLVNYTDASVNFYDPINQMGDWHGSGTYAAYHTQSTHANADNTCISSGGMDDRFDFILNSLSIKNGTQKIKYIPGTYKALGQDGLRINQSINSPVNNTIPLAVADALFNNSDHLPVIAKYEVTIPGTVFVENMEYKNEFLAFINNPVKDNIILNIADSEMMNLNCEILSVYGQKLQMQKLKSERSGIYTIPASNLQKGIYLLRLYNNNQELKVIKFVKL